MLRQVSLRVLLVLCAYLPHAWPGYRRLNRQRYQDFLVPNVARYTTGLKTSHVKGADETSHKINSYLAQRG